MLELKRGLDAKARTPRCVCGIAACAARLRATTRRGHARPESAALAGGAWLSVRRATAAWRCPPARARPSRCCRSSPLTSSRTRSAASSSTARAPCRRWRRRARRLRAATSHPVSRRTGARHGRGAVCALTLRANLVAHSVAAQVLAELRVLQAYREPLVGRSSQILALGLSSRKNMCIHPKARLLDSVRRHPARRAADARHPHATHARAHTPCRCLRRAAARTWTPAAGG
jgi:hypothetical protein